jgi:hypothetical protein
MNLQPVWMRSVTVHACARPVLLVLLLLTIPSPCAHAGPHEMARLSRPAIAAVAPVLADGWSLSRLFSPIQRLLNNRARLIQFGAIGVAIGIYILMRK